MRKCFGLSCRSLLLGFLGRCFLLFVLFGAFHLYADEPLVGWVDAIPDSVSDTSGSAIFDSDNYFKDIDADGKEVKLFYKVRNQSDKVIRDLKIKAFGLKDDEHAIWILSGCSTIEGTSGVSFDYSNFPTNSTLRFQLEVTYSNVTEKILVTNRTDIADAESLIGWQCPQECLAVHNLVYKHRPVIFMGSGETIAINGPVHPLDEKIISEYRLRNELGGKVTIKYGDYNDIKTDNVLSLLENYNAKNYYLQMKGYDEAEEVIDDDGEQPLPCHESPVTIGCHLIENQDVRSTPNHIFIQYWMYYTASYRPKKTFMTAQFTHDGDWEMVQFCVNINTHKKKKTDWFLPFAVTGSQHYYGQTLGWKLGVSSSKSAKKQRFVTTQDDGNRPEIFVAENTHATYFRNGKIDSYVFGKLGTQVQYDNSPNAGYDEVSTSLTEVAKFDLYPLYTNSFLCNWEGFWGGFHRQFKGADRLYPPRGPKFRTANALNNVLLNMFDNPRGFLHRCRKIVDEDVGELAPETALHYPSLGTEIKVSLRDPTEEEIPIVFLEASIVREGVENSKSVFAGLERLELYIGLKGVYPIEKPYAISYYGSNLKYNWDISSLKPGDVYEITARGYGTDSTRSTEVATAIFSYTIPASLPETYVVSGTVAGEIVDGTTVEMRLSAAGVSRSAELIPEGGFSFPTLPDGEYTVFPKSSDYQFDPAVQSVTVAGGDFWMSTAFVATPLLSQYDLAYMVGGENYPDGTDVKIDETGNLHKHWTFEMPYSSDVETLQILPVGVAGLNNLTTLPMSVAVNGGQTFRVEMEFERPSTVGSFNNAFEFRDGANQLYTIGGSKTFWNQVDGVEDRTYWAKLIDLNLFPTADSVTVDWMASNVRFDEVLILRSETNNHAWRPVDGQSYSGVVQGGGTVLNTSSATDSTLVDMDVDFGVSYYYIAFLKYSDGSYSDGVATATTVGSLPSRPYDITESNPCQSGGGTHGSILKMVYEAVGDARYRFKVSKKDGTPFSTSGTIFLKVGAHEHYGKTYDVAAINEGDVDSGWLMSHDLNTKPLETFPKKIYARYVDENQNIIDNYDNEYSWVGPFTITAPRVDDVENLASLKDWLTDELVKNENSSLGSVKTRLNLPEIGPYASTITWETSAPALVQIDGDVFRPTIGSGNSNVTLTATITKKDSTLQKVFVVTVLAETKNPIEQSSYSVGSLSGTFDWVPTRYGTDDHGNSYIITPAHYNSATEFSTSISIPKDGSLTLTYSETNGDDGSLSQTAMTLYAPDGTTYVTGRSTSGQSIVPYLAPGSYTLKVSCGTHTSQDGYFSVSAVFTNATDVSHEVANNDAITDDDGDVIQSVVDGLPDLSVLKTVTGSVGYRNGLSSTHSSYKMDTEDWYKFTVEEDGELKLHYTSTGTLDPGHTYDAGVYLVSSNGTTIIASRGVRSSSPLTYRSLSPGTYYIRIKNGSSGYSHYGAYSIQFDYTPSNSTEPTEGYLDDNDTYTRATVVSDDTIIGSVGYRTGLNTDYYDWYQVEVDKDGELKLHYATTGTLNPGHTYDGGLSLISSDGITTIASQGFRSSSPLTYRSLSPGTYYIRIENGSSGYSHYGAYSIQLEFTPSNSNEPTESYFDDNDTYAKATVLSGDMVAGSVGYRTGLDTDYYDWYQFNVDKDGELKLHYTTTGTLDPGHTYDGGLSLISSDGITTIASQGFRSSSPLTYRSLAPGTYYIRIENGSSGYSHYGAYLIQVDYTPSNSTEPTEGYLDNNDTYTNATEVSGDTIIGSVGYRTGLDTDDYDWYQFEVDKDCALKLHYTTTGTLDPGHTYDGGLSLISSDGTTTIASQGFRSSSPLTYRSLSPGTYYIRIKNGSSGYSHYGAYSIQLEFTLSNSDEPTETYIDGNDTYQTANTFSGNLITGSVGYRTGIDTDAEDWYRFEVDKDGELKLHYATTGTLNPGHTYDGGLSLISSDGTKTIASQGFRSSSPLICRSLSPGTYYIRIKNGSSGYSHYGSYSIQLEFTEACANPTEVESNNVYTNGSAFEGVTAVESYRKSAVPLGLFAHGSFESGDLSGWTVVSGDATNMPTVSERVVFNPVGSNFVGTGESFVDPDFVLDESRLVTLRSDEFVIPTNCNYITFALGGTHETNVFVSLLDMTNQSALLTRHAVGSEGMWAQVLDVSAYHGKRCAIQIVDGAATGHLNVDGFAAYEKMPRELFFVEMRGSIGYRNGLSSSHSNYWYDAADWYEMPVVPEGYDITIDMSDFGTLLGDATVYVYEENGSTLIASKAMRYKTFTMKDVPAGMYWVKVANNSSSRYGGYAVRATYQKQDLPVEMVTDALPSGQVGADYFATLEACKGTLPYQWSVPEKGTYSESTEANSFSEMGVAQRWKTDDDSWLLTLPFAFPFYGSNYSTCWIDSNGKIRFDGSGSEYIESVDRLKAHPMIAVLWDDLITSDGDVYVSATDSAVTIRWEGLYYSESTPVAFSATLEKSGCITLKYGDGNAIGGLIGVSAGDGVNYWLSAHSQNGRMHQAPNLLFTESKGLPEGLSLSTSGDLTGTPSETFSNQVQFTVHDAEGSTVSREIELVIRPGSITDADLDGLPDEWENRFGGGLNPTALCANGVNTVREAYIAGLDPTNSTSRLILNPVSGNALHWSAISGRVYSIWWTTNLLESFQPLETNLLWTQGGYTNPNPNPCDYYKIKVELE